MKDNAGKLVIPIVVGILCIGVFYLTQNNSTQPIDSLFQVKDVLSDQTHPYHDWVYNLQGRVLKNSHMSASVWSLRPEAGPALIVSAIHTLGEGYLGPGGKVIEERLVDPSEQLGATRLYLVKEDGSLDDLASVLHILYNPEVPADQSGNFLRDILPRHDFFIGVMDSQRVIMEPLPSAPESLKPESPIIFDPLDLTTTAPTYADVTPGESVILMGYPKAEEYEGGMAASVGRVLNDSKAEEAIQYLSDRDDEEGGISYDPEVEMIIEGYAVMGMSGGGVYNAEGQQVGILVRASNEFVGIQYVRAVRMTYVVNSLMSAYGELSDSKKAVIVSYLE